MLYQVVREPCLELLNCFFVLRLQVRPLMNMHLYFHKSSRANWRTKGAFGFFPSFTCLFKVISYARNKQVIIRTVGAFRFFFFGSSSIRTLSSDSLFYRSECQMIIIWKDGGFLYLVYILLAIIHIAVCIICSPL
jgi:hypothetical protein